MGRKEGDLFKALKRRDSRQSEHQMEKRPRLETEWSWENWRAIKASGPITDETEYHPSSIFDPHRVIDIVDDMTSVFGLGSAWNTVTAPALALRTLEIEESFVLENDAASVAQMAQIKKDSLDLSLHHLQYYLLYNMKHNDLCEADVNAVSKIVHKCLNVVSRSFKIIMSSTDFQETESNATSVFQYVNSYELKEKEVHKWMQQELIHYMDQRGLLIDVVGTGKSMQNIIVEEKRGTFRFYEQYRKKDHAQSQQFSYIRTFLTGVLHPYLLENAPPEYKGLAHVNNKLMTTVTQWNEEVGVPDLKTVHRLDHVVSFDIMREDTVEPGVVVLARRSFVTDSDGRKIPLPSYPKLFDINIEDDDYREYGLPRNFSSRQFLSGTAVPLYCNNIVNHLANGGYFISDSSQRPIYTDVDSDPTLVEVLDELIDEQDYSIQQIWDESLEDIQVENFRQSLDYTAKVILLEMIALNPVMKDFYNIFITQNYGARCGPIINPKPTDDPEACLDGYEYPWWELACVIAFSMGRNLMPVLNKDEEFYHSISQFACYIWGLPRTGKSLLQMLVLETYRPDDVHYTDNQKSATFNGLQKHHKISAIVDNQKEGNANQGLTNSFMLPMISKEPVRHESKFQQPFFKVFPGPFFGVGNATLPKSAPMSRRLIICRFNTTVPPELIKSELKEKLRKAMPLITWLSATMLSWIDHIFGQRYGGEPSLFLPPRFSVDKKSYDNCTTLNYFLSTEFDMGGTLQNSDWIPVRDNIQGRVTLQSMFKTWEQDNLELVSGLESSVFSEEKIQEYCGIHGGLCNNLTGKEKKDLGISVSKTYCVVRRCKKAVFDDK